MGVCPALSGRISSAAARRKPGALDPGIRTVSYTHLKKWEELFEVHKRVYNFSVRKGLFPEEKIVTSLLDI